MSFASRLKALRGNDLEALWAPMRIRQPERVEAWIMWLDGEGELPESRVKDELHLSSMEESEVPELSDALDRLDELGFILNSL